jgi:hypothetical protein
MTGSVKFVVLEGGAEMELRRLPATIGSADEATCGCRAWRRATQ